MRRKLGFLAIGLIGLLAFSSCASMVTQIKKNTDIDFNKENLTKEEALKLENPKFFKLWTEWKPIKFLMTKEEKKIIKEILKIADTDQKNLKSAEFINWFWVRRDDNKYDAMNRFKEDFYNRVIEAQTRFANKEDVQYFRKSKYGRGWQTDMGLIYIIFGEPFDRVRHDVAHLMSMMSLFNSSRPQYQQALMPHEVEIWYFDVPLDEYHGGLFQDGTAWILFERDMSGYWEYGHSAFDLFYSYELYQQYYFAQAAINYSTYMGEVWKLIKAFARSYVYDKDLEFKKK